MALSDQNTIGAMNRYIPFAGMAATCVRMGSAFMQLASAPDVSVEVYLRLIAISLCWNGVTLVMTIPLVMLWAWLRR